VDPEGRAYVEAMAHQGLLKGGQIRKVIMDAFKIVFVARTRPRAKMLLSFSDSRRPLPLPRSDGSPMQSGRSIPRSSWSMSLTR
jgi:hypothetical protein